LGSRGAPPLGVGAGVQGVHAQGAGARGGVWVRGVG